MGAIAGIIGWNCKDAWLDKICSTLTIRGAKESHTYIGEDFALIYGDASKMQLSEEKQPIQLSWGGEKYSIVFDGRIYNIEEIRKLLITLGHKFIGFSDAEVVLHSYVQWAENCVEKFNGVFAFAIWEFKRKKLFLARDRIGVKPVFYKIHNGGIIFASQIKSILAVPTVKAEIDEEGVGEILLLGPGRTPGNGVLRGIRELEPGCYGYFAAGKWNWKRYWKLTDREHSDDFEETAQKVRALLEDAIQLQIKTDGKLGAFLSGGLDSGIVSSVISEKLTESGKQLSTFSLDYENNDKYFVSGKFQPERDNAYIEKMQMYLHSQHTWSVLKPEQLTDTLYEATIARDLPGMADVDSSLLVFCGEICKQVGVALSGECADEIFGGYPWYRDPDVRAVNGFPWSQNISLRAGFLSEDMSRRLNVADYVYDKYKETIDQCDILPQTQVEERRIKEMVNLNHRWFMQTLLDRNDRMSMYHNLEVRVPFCDYRIVEYLYGVPWEFKNYQGREKGLLRYAMSGYLPEDVLYRKKSPYPKTYDRKYLQLVRERLQELLNKKDAPIYQIVNKNALESLMTAEFSSPWYGQLMRVPQTIAYMLQINFWLEYNHIDIV